MIYRPVDVFESFHWNSANNKKEIKKTENKKKDEKIFDNIERDFNFSKPQQITNSRTMASVLLEARPYRPFKSSEEYLYAMREDLAEWLNTLYPELLINVDNFMDRLDTGIALCKVRILIDFALFVCLDCCIHHDDQRYEIGRIS